MAQLKDTTITGSARVTDTLYANSINGLILTTAATGFTIAGGTTSKTLTVADTVTLNAPTQWGIVYGGASGTYTSTAAGTSGQYLKSNGSAAPTWETFSGATVGLGDVENTKLSTWTGTSNITTIGTISSGTVPWARLSDVPTATTSAKGLMQVGTGLSVSSGTVSIDGINTSSGDTTKCLTEKGTWATFGTSNLTIGTSASTAMAGNTTVTNVAIAANTTTSGNYPVVFATSNTSTTTAKDEGLQKSGAQFYFNPSTGNLAATTFNSYTLAAACAKAVDTSLTISSTSTNLPTSAAVATLVSNNLIEIIRL